MGSWCCWGSSGARGACSGADRKGATAARNAAEWPRALGFFVVAMVAMAVTLAVAVLALSPTGGMDQGAAAPMLAHARLWRVAVIVVAISSLALALMMPFLIWRLRKAGAHLAAQQSALHRSQALQQAVVETVIDAIVVIDERGAIESVNPAFEKIFGYTFDDVRGKNVGMLMPARERHAHDGYMKHYLATGERRIIGIGREEHGLRKDGSVFPMDLAVSETLIDGRRFFTGLIRDISARKEAETALRESQARQREYEHHACVDVLSGLHNRRWLEETFARQLARCAQEGQPATLIMLDADRFKQYNDTQGHFGGDCALRALGHAIMENVRPNDLAARYGGEEFAVLLPDTSLEQGIAVAERLRRAVEVMPVHTPDGQCLPSITLSLGLAETQGGATLQSLITAADGALYRAKAAGRNRVVADRARDASPVPAPNPCSA